MADLLDAQPAPVVLIGHSLGGLLALGAALVRPTQVRALVLEGPARPGSDAPDPVFAAETESFLDAMLDTGAQVARMRFQTSWSRAEVEAWAACKPDVDRASVRRGLWLGDTEWEDLFNRLVVPTRVLVPPGSGMAPDPAALHNALLRTAWSPTPAIASAVTSLF